MLVDGGNGRKDYKYFLRQEVLEIAERGEALDLVVATHQDNDHIKGIRWLLRDMSMEGASSLAPELIRRCWFNAPTLLGRLLNAQSHGSTDIGLRDARELESAILTRCNNDCWDRETLIKQHTEFDLHGAKITVLSPDTESIQVYNDQINRDISSTEPDYALQMSALVDKERRNMDVSEDLDTSVSNASSIALLFEIGGCSILLLGDAIPRVVDPGIEQLLAKRGLKTLDVDLIVLPHHGSHRNISRRFLSVVRAPKFAFSTNGRAHNLPNKATMAKILIYSNPSEEPEVNFYFNYSSVFQAMQCTDRERHNYRFNCHPPNWARGYRFDL